MKKKNTTFEIRDREGALRSKYSGNKLKADETTYHFSSEKKEQEFIRKQFTTEEEIKKYKEYRLEWHRRAGEMDAGKAPLAVICELTSLCNLKCEMCYTRTPAFQKSVIGKQRVIPWDTVVRLVDECAEIGVYSMLFSWRGEPAMYRSKGSDGKWHDFADALAYARQKGILEITSLCNGRLLTDSLIEKLVRAEPSWLSFSIDGLHDTYIKIRKQTSGENEQDPFEIVTGNVKKIVKLRDSLGLTRPQIRTNTIFPAIQADFNAYRDYMEEIGVGLVTVNEMLDFRGDELPEDQIDDNWLCQYPFQRLVVSANGSIMPCPGSHNEEEDMIVGRYIGAAPKQVVVDGKTKYIEYPEMTLREAWQSKRIQEIRQSHITNRRKEIRTCKYCRHGLKKRGVTWVPDEWDSEKMEWTDVAWRSN
jgi:MoaA/NifB/PqqE/SkfB family radical SAM enzyme